MKLSALKAKLIRETPKAMLLEFEEGDEHWVPRSIVDYIHKEPPVEGQPQKVEVELPDWFIEKEGL